MIDAEMNVRWSIKITVAAIVGILLLSAGCATNPDGTTEYKRTAIGALGGAAVGAGSGALIAGSGHAERGSHRRRRGSGRGRRHRNYMDRQAAEMKRKLPEAAVAARGTSLCCSPIGILFDVDRAETKPTAKDSIAKAAEVLVKYPDTYITVEGTPTLPGRRTTIRSSANGEPMRSGTSY